MAKMFVLLSHCLTEAQYKDATNVLKVHSFVTLESTVWSNIPVDAENVSCFLEELQQCILKSAEENDFLLVQGDYGATVVMVNFAFKHKLIPVYATTQRRVNEIIVGNKVKSIRTFEHVRFRNYIKAS